MRLYGLLGGGWGGGASMYSCAKHGVHNLVESGTFLHKHNSPFIVSLKLLLNA